MLPPDFQLVSAKPEHAETILGWRLNPDFNSHLPDPKLRTVETMAMDLVKCGASLSDQNTQKYRWFLYYGDRIVATSSFKGIDWQNGYGELGYGVAPNQWGKGFGFLVVRATIAKIFTESTILRVQAVTSVNNYASQKILTKTGFSREGILREYLKIGTNNVDHILYSILKKEWKPY